MSSPVLPSVRCEQCSLTTVTLLTLFTVVKRNREDSMAEASVEPISRRDRLRADTVREIKQTARRVLVDQGVDGLALRAVAREMGMSAPALYRYFDSREDLVENVVADLYDELVAVLEAARDDARPATAPIQLLACSRAFRRWATTHHAEFGLLFGSAGDGVVPAHGTLRARGQPRRARRPAVRRGLRRPRRADLRRARLPDPGRRRDRARPAGAAARAGARSSPSSCRWASCRCSCRAGSGSTAWSAWRSSGT